MYALSLAFQNLWKNPLRNALIVLILIFGFLVPYADANQYFSVQKSVEDGRLKSGYSEIRFDGGDEIVEIADRFRGRQGVSVSTVYNLDTFRNGQYARLPVMVFDESYLQSHNVVVTEGTFSAAPGDDSCYLSVLHNNTVFPIFVGDTLQLGDTRCTIRGIISSFDFWMPIWLPNNPSLNLYAPGYQKIVVLYVRDDLLPAIIEELTTQSVDAGSLQIRTSEELDRMNRDIARGGTLNMLKLSVWIVLAAAMSIIVLSVARYDAEKKRMGIRIGLGASPLSIGLENAMGLFLLAFLSAPILHLLLPVYLRRSRFMPIAPVDLRVLFLYLIVQAGISLLYGLFVTLTVFRKPVIESIR